ncbi:hypothetical protein L1987_32622 [Smallanthus sonchifolius]|uniref:Uncharacterized protein n=1 Tax=Smallanthus sonchifolius TaxID=185202 RepID=A0ACB9HQ41_9ASTR|nr:hypothetical protein L1987_32622 [Smallanthus sonchifolius]
MQEFVKTIQHDFTKTLWNTEEITSNEEIEITVVVLMGHWIKKVFGVSGPDMNSVKASKVFSDLCCHVQSPSHRS